MLADVPYYAKPQETILFKLAIHSKLFVLSLIDAKPIIISFKIFNVKDNKIALLGDLDDVLDYFENDLYRLLVAADIIRTGRPIPFGIPYRVDPTTKLKVTNTKDYPKKPEYRANDEFSLAHIGSRYKRVLRMKYRPDYGHALHMDIEVCKLADNTAKIYSMDFPQNDAMIMMTILSRRLNHILVKSELEHVNSLKNSKGT